jgi:hypothetical protein
MGKVNEAMTTVCAILYLAIGGTLLLSAAIVWLSRKLQGARQR